MIADDVLAQAYVDWKNAPYGHKSDAVRKWAKALDRSYNCVYASIRRICPTSRKRRNDMGNRMNPEVDDWTRIIWGIKLRPPGEAGQISSDQAVRLALKEKKIPLEAANIPVATFNRIARDLELNRTEGRFARFQAKYANLTHQFDGSQSKFFHVARKLSDGDYLLRMHRPAKKPYKNQPMPIGLKLLLYGAVDDYSGMHICRYVVGLGESGPDGITFLQYAWGKKEDSRSQFRGLPSMLYLDNGAVKKNLAVKDYLERLDIKVIPRAPYNSRAGGKIERPWETLFHRLELPFFAENNWEKFEIKFSELNRQLPNYHQEYNAMPHRWLKGLTREQVWWQSINERGGIIDVAPESLSTVFRRKKHSVRGGYFTHDTVEYEVTGLDNGPIWVCEGMFNDRMVAVHRKTQMRYEVKKFVPKSFGQRSKMVISKAEALAEESRDKIQISNTLYSENQSAKVVKLPVRKKEERKVEDPLSLKAEGGRMKDEEDEERIFASERERYEWLLERKIGGEVLPDDEIEFMTEFEKTGLYGQLSATYRRWGSYQKKRIAAGGSR